MKYHRRPHYRIDVHKPLTPEQRDALLIRAKLLERRGWRVTIKEHVK